jgi:hypothetical protein
MIAEAISKILSLKKPELIETIDGQYIDNNGTYKRVPRNRPFNRIVCNVDSFAKAVIEQVRRDGEDQDASFMTVIFERSGGIFYTDDTLGEEQDTWRFQREYTHLWETIINILGRKLSHRQLLDQLESVKIFVPDFENLYHTISKLRASKKINFVSNPIFENGEQAGSYQWEQKIDSNGATQKAICPSEINFQGKIVRGSEIEYQFSLALTPILEEEKGQILFSLSMPGFDMVLDQVREDEYMQFCGQIKTKDIKNLLILRNY